MTTPTSATADLRYPIGKPVRAMTLSPAARSSAIDVIASAPAGLRAAVDGLSDAQLDTPYRPDGWTVRQLVHHVADSHMNAYIRFRFALAADNVTVNPYDENAWANLHDARTLPVQPSLDLLDALHERLVTLLRATPADAFSRTVQHPDNGPMSVDSLLAVYSWHGRHHTAHVTGLRERMGW